MGSEIGCHQSPFLRSEAATSLVVSAGFFSLDGARYSVRMGWVLLKLMVVVVGDLLLSNSVSTLAAALHVGPTGG